MLTEIETPDPEITFIIDPPSAEVLQPWKEKLKRASLSFLKFSASTLGHGEQGAAKFAAPFLKTVETYRTFSIHSVQGGIAVVSAGATIGVTTGAIAALAKMFPENACFRSLLKATKGPISAVFEFSASWAFAWEMLTFLGVGMGGDAYRSNAYNKIAAPFIAGVLAVGIASCAYKEVKERLPKPFVQVMSGLKGADIVAAMFALLLQQKWVEEESSLPIFIPVMLITAGLFYISELFADKMPRATQGLKAALTIGLEFPVLAFTLFSMIISIKAGEKHSVSDEFFHSTVAFVAVVGMLSVSNYLAETYKPRKEEMPLLTQGDELTSATTLPSLA